jgi:hypothetical protein
MHDRSHETGRNQTDGGQDCQDLQRSQSAFLFKLKNIRTCAFQAEKYSTSKHISGHATHEMATAQYRDWYMPSRYAHRDSLIA